MSFEVSSLLLILFGFGLCAIIIAIIFTNLLFKSIILLSAASLMIGLCYLCMDAPDVAMTEAAIGACLSTVVLLSFARKISSDDIGGIHRQSFAAIICLFVAAVIIYAGFDLGIYGDATTQVHAHVNQYYLANTGTEIGIPSFVAAILASYRGYDTLGETTVIFIAALAAFMIMGRDKNAK